MTNIVKEDLQSIIERIERLNEEKQDITDDIKSVFDESKSRGFDVPTLRKLIKIRKQDPSEIEEQEILLETYQNALFTND